MIFKNRSRRIEKRSTFLSERFIWFLRPIARLSATHQYMQSRSYLVDWWMIYYAQILLKSSNDLMISHVFYVFCVFVYFMDCSYSRYHQLNCFSKSCPFRRNSARLISFMKSLSVKSRKLRVISSLALWLILQKNSYFYYLRTISS